MSGLRQLHFVVVGALALSAIAFAPDLALAQGATPTHVPTVQVPTVQVPPPGAGGGNTAFGASPTAGAASETVGATHPGPAPAQAYSGGPAPAPVIMVVDIERIMHEAKAMKSFQAQVEGLQQNMQKELAQVENDLRAQQNQLQHEQNTMAPDVFAEKGRAFERSVTEAKQTADARKKALDQGAGEALDKVKRVLVEVVKQVQVERHANVVMRGDMMMYADPAYDVSPEVLRRVDERITSVQVVIPRTESTAAVPAAPAAKKK